MSFTGTRMNVFVDEFDFLKCNDDIHADFDIGMHAADSPIKTNLRH